MREQVVIVTGAGSGMGAAIALSFAKQHATLCITDINEQGLLKTSAECQELSKNKVLKIAGDLTKETFHENIIKGVLEEFGRIDVLVNCAGIYEITSLQDLDIMEKFDRIFAVNLRSIVAITNKALPSLIENKGCVINITSVCSTMITREGLIYCMTKSGLATFTKCAALQLARLGVRVNAIAPGAVRTNIYNNVLPTKEEVDYIYDQMEETVPLKKSVKAEEIGELAVYLASDKASSITGSEFFVDAGMLLGHIDPTAGTSGGAENIS